MAIMLELYRAQFSPFVMSFPLMTWRKALLSPCYLLDLSVDVFLVDTFQIILDAGGKDITVGD